MGHFEKCPKNIEQKIQVFQILFFLEQSISIINNQKIQNKTKQTKKNSKQKPKSARILFEREQKPLNTLGDVWICLAFQAKCIQLHERTHAHYGDTIFGTETTD